MAICVWLSSWRSISHSYALTMHRNPLAYPYLSPSIHLLSCSSTESLPTPSLRHCTDSSYSSCITHSHNAQHTSPYSYSQSGLDSLLSSPMPPRIANSSAMNWIGSPSIAMPPPSECPQIPKINENKIVSPIGVDWITAGLPTDSCCTRRTSAIYQSMTRSPRSCPCSNPPIAISERKCLQLPSQSTSSPMCSDCTTLWSSWRSHHSLRDHGPIPEMACNIS